MAPSEDPGVSLGHVEASLDATSGARPGSGIALLALKAGSRVVRAAALAPAWTGR